MNYIHPNWMIAEWTGSMYMVKRWPNNHDYIDPRLFVIADSILLKEFWFKPEQQEDWIDKAYEYYQTPMPAQDKDEETWNKMKFRQAIEKDLPNHI